ncbi:hypothetical protein N2152v2_000163 [Parachlorella kessleri]
MAGTFGHSASLRAASRSMYPSPCSLHVPTANSYRRRCRGLQQQTRPQAAASNNGASVVPASAAGAGVVSDAAVPEGHKGLHSFLYGEGGAEAHEGGTSSYDFREGEDDGSSLVEVGAWLEAREGQRPVGVYALYDARRNLQYVGLSRNCVLAIKAHLQRVGEERCAFVRLMVFANKAMQSRSLLEREAANWLEEAGTLPPGNGAEQDEWEGTTFSTDHMTPEQRAAYEEKKLKMRKAMGENLHDAVDGETVDAKTRRLNLIKAVEGDNWSAVIGDQTEETMPAGSSDAGRLGAAAAAAAGASEAGAQQARQPAQQPKQVVTPFARASVHRTVGDSSAAAAASSRSGNGGGPPKLTVEAVDRVLDDVRPFLIADGGNVDVVGVENGVVMLQLQGACGTCPSSSATMKMGIERALKAAFGDLLKEVMQVGAPNLSASVEAVDMHLNMIRGAISSYGGFVDVLSVEEGVCRLRYVGPPPIGMGVKAAVKDKFPDIKEVVFIEE